jgi:hypothetical protein
MISSNDSKETESVATPDGTFNAVVNVVPTLICTCRLSGATDMDEFRRQGFTDERVAHEISRVNSTMRFLLSRGWQTSPKPCHEIRPELS